MVVGGGPAGASAAIEAAKWGAQVTLVDENPLDQSMMALDIPLYFGQRMMPTVRDKGLMLQRVVSANQLLSEAQENGVEVLLSTYVWGSFRNQENSRQISRSVLGLADQERSRLLGYDALVLAPGARDLVLGFPGRHLAGVMGANAAASLMRSYQAMTSKRMVVLGSGDLALSTALMALERGIKVEAIVDISSESRGTTALKDGLEDAGVDFQFSHTIKEAKGYREVRSVVIERLDDKLRPNEDSEQEIECDTICLALGLVPSVELPYLTGCHLNFHAELGGFVPQIDQQMETTAGGVFIAGDGAGFYETMVSNPDIARDQGRLAGMAAAGYLGLKVGDKAAAFREASVSSSHASNGGKTAEYLSSWLSSLIAAGGMEVNVCQCEEVTRRELLNIAPPRYLGWSGKEMDTQSMDTLLQDGPVNPDQLKRLTRAGMGYCQGRRCREEVAMLVARSSGIEVSQIPLASYRPPVRPLPLKVMWPHEESEQVRTDWVKWFRYPAEQLERVKGYGETS